MKTRRDVNLSARDAFAICELAAELYMRRWPGRSRSDVRLDEFLLHIEAQFDPAKRAEWEAKVAHLVEPRVRRSFYAVDGRYVAIERFADGTERRCDLGIAVRDDEPMPTLMWPSDEAWKAGRV